jgi:hypothetical protein
MSAVLLAAWSGTLPVAALTMQECSTKFSAARAAGTLGGMTWQQFRQAQCGAGASAATGVGSAALNPGATFPKGISPKYANEPPGKARLHTCLDQYRANKAANRNGSLRWIAKGGGYFSECNKRLKG